MPRKLPIHSKWARTLAGLFFCLSGAFVSLLLSVGSPSFWYLLCGALWAVSGVVWFFRPSLASGLSMFPVLGVAVLAVQAIPHSGELDAAYWLFLLCIVIALALIGVSFQWRSAQQWILIAISLGLVLIAFGVDRLWTNRVSVLEYSMHWSANGVAPWGRIETNAKGEPPVVIYRRVNGGYCYDAIFSTELSQRLSKSNKPTTSVEYNVFSDFGHRRGYNIHAIDGLIFNEGQHALRPGESYGGYIELNNPIAVDCGR
jgi:hypothetical protein